MKVDYNFLEAKIRNIGEEDLKTISASSLKLYSLDIQEATKKYVSSLIEETYNKHVGIIPDNKRGEFLNLETGYVMSMMKWVNETPIDIPDIGIQKDVEEEYSERGETSSLREFVQRREVQIIGAGTAISLILFLSGWKWVALLAESVAVALGLYTYNNCDVKKEINTQKRQEFEENLSRNIENIQKSAIKWAEKAEASSNKMLGKYN
jgi:hypothetical protein